MPANFENSAVATGLEKVSFHSNPKERQCQKMFKFSYTCTHFTYRKKILRILQARLQQYVNYELPDVRAGFEKGRSNCQHLLDHRKSKGIKTKNCFIDYAKEFVWITRNWKILKEMEIPDHLTSLLRNLYAGQEATESEMKQCTDWKLGKEYIRLYIITLFI